MKKIWMSLVVVGAMLVGSGVLMMPAMAEIGDICEDGKIPDDLKEAAGCEIEKDKTTMPAVVYLIDLVVGAVAVVSAGMIVYGAITYVISTGDAAKLTRARNTIIYAAVGLVVALLAYAIVNFVGQSVQI